MSVTRVESLEWTSWVHRLAVGVVGRSSVVSSDELAQEACARLIARYGNEWVATRPIGVIKGLVLRVLRNLFIDELRRRQPVADELVVSRAPSADLDPEASFVAADERRRLDTALAKMSPQEREFVLAVMRCDSVPAAQRKVGWPYASPYYHLARLLASLRAELR